MLDITKKIFKKIDRRGKHDSIPRIRHPFVTNPVKSLALGSFDGCLYRLNFKNEIVDIIRHDSLLDCLSRQDGSAGRKIQRIMMADEHGVDGKVKG